MVKRLVVHVIGRYDIIQKSVHMNGHWKAYDFKMIDLTVADHN